MSDKKPLKRVKELRQYSIDHHHGLLLGWKIRTGIRKAVERERLSRYAIWFYDTHLAPHFELEEKYMFPVLGKKHPLIESAIGEHLQLRSIMASPLDNETLVQFADLLERHIRFEEREIFGLIQAVATAAQLAVIEQIHYDVPFTEHWDEFWK